jgi:hypothetical protein
MGGEVQEAICEDSAIWEARELANAKAGYPFPPVGPPWFDGDMN